MYKILVKIFYDKNVFKLVWEHFLDSNLLFGAQIENFETLLNPQTNFWRKTFKAQSCKKQRKYWKMYKFLTEFFVVKMPTKCFENTFLTQNYFFIEDSKVWNQSWSTNTLHTQNIYAWKTAKNSVNVQKCTNSLLKAF